MEGMLEAYSNNSKACSETVTKHETIEVDSVGYVVPKQTNDFSLDSDYSWIEDDGSQPWWKTTDRNELAFLVLQKSHNYVENCDLPPPRKKYIGEQSYADISDYNIKTCFDCEAKSSVFSNFTAEAKEGLDSGLMHRKLETPSNEGHLSFSFDKSSNTTMQEDDIEQAFEGDQSKARLMEALCHSQTRAREAEELAKQAYADKERIITLFFIQASQLYAYKQWCTLLHLETLNTQIKIKHKPVSTLFPETLPWTSIEGKKPTMRKRKFVNDKQEKLGKLRSDVSTTCDAAFALGLSLAGAGLLLGWTVGWMLPRL